jgi:hypothetical protein
MFAAPKAENFINTFNPMSFTDIILLYILFPRINSNIGRLGTKVLRAEKIDAAHKLWILIRRANNNIAVNPTRNPSPI